MAGQPEPTEVRAIIAHLNPDLTGFDLERATRRVETFASGDPDAVWEIASELARSADDQLPIPSWWQGWVDDLNNKLAPDVATRLAQVAAFGHGLPVGHIAEVLGTEIDEIIDLGEKTHELGLVHAGLDSEFWFVNPAIGQAVARWQRKSRSHALCEAASGHLFAAGDVCSGARLALDAGPLLKPTRVAHQIEAAAAHHAQLGEYFEAAELCRRFSALCREPAIGLRIAFVEGSMIELTGFPDRAHELYQQVIRNADIDDPDQCDLVAQAATGTRSSRIGGSNDRLDRLHAARRRLTRAETALGRTLADATLVELCSELLMAAHEPVAEQLADLDRVAAGVGPVAVSARRIQMVVAHQHGNSRLDDFVDLGQRALDLVGSSRGDGFSSTLTVAIHGLLHHGDWSRATQWCSELANWGADAADTDATWKSLLFRSALSGAQGLTERADELATEAFETGVELGVEDASISFAAHLLLGALRAGSLAGLADQIADGGAAQQLPIVAAFQGLAALDGGRFGQAREIIDGFIVGPVGDAFRPADICLGSLLALRIGDTAKAVELGSELRKWQGQLLFLGYGGGFVGPTDWYMSAIAERAGYRDQADGLAGAAARTLAAVGASTWTPPSTVVED